MKFKYNLKIFIFKPFDFQRQIDLFEHRNFTLQVALYLYSACRFEFQHRELQCALFIPRRRRRRHASREMRGLFPSPSGTHEAPSQATGAQEIQRRGHESSGAILTPLPNRRAPSMCVTWGAVLGVERVFRWMVYAVIHAGFLGCMRKCVAYTRAHVLGM